MKRGFLLDTDTCIFALNGVDRVIAALVATPRSAVHVSVVTAGELLTGAAKSDAPTKAKRRVSAFLAPLRVLEITAEDAVVYATVRARLEARGTPIGPLDTWIAAHALARGLTLVTHNAREFGRVVGLARADWRS